MSVAWIGIATSPALLACSDTTATDCAMDVESLPIRTETDVEFARGVRSVSGNVSIKLDTGEVSPRDLSFLGCLESAESIRIIEAPGLEATTGALRLTNLRSLWVTGPDDLKSLDGFDNVDSIEKIYVENAPALISVSLPHTEHVGELEVGMCGAPPGDPDYLPFNPALVEIGPFESLRDLKDLVIMGNSVLTSLSLLESLYENDSPPLRNIVIGNNPKLSESEIDPDIAALDARPDQVEGGCGNLGSEEKVCTCLWGE
jgi:hypothetical protein